MNNKLNPCPFCGKDGSYLSVRKSSGWATSEQPFCVRCRGCGCAGPALYNHVERQAVESWNIRR